MPLLNSQLGVSSLATFCQELDECLPLPVPTRCYAPTNKEDSARAISLAELTATGNVHLLAGYCELIYYPAGGH